MVFNLGRVVYALVGSICVFSHSVAIGALISTSDGDGADAFVWYAQPNSNYGTEEIVAIKADSGGLLNSRKGYLRFDVSSIADPIDIVALSLVYTGTNAANAPADPSTYNIYGLTDGGAGETWGESTITWNNAPANVASSANGVDLALASFLGSFDINQPVNPDDVFGLSSSDLTAFVQADTDGLVTLIITRAQTNFSIEYFASRESNSYSAPLLDITTSDSNGNPMPIPSGIALLLVGIVGWFGQWKPQKL